LPRQYIPKGGGAATTFEYSGTGERVRRIRGESETIYLGDAYEHETNGNVVTDRFYVHNDERVIAVVERLASGDAWRFVHTDHLGSADVISNDGGVEIDRSSFDAWGAARDPKWGGNGPASSNTITRRGFTWHEGDDDVGLINAKGRIYDPKIARFLQTDPIISNPLNAQTYNPYSYVHNRPLVFTDPSGYDAEAVSVLEYGGGDPGYIAPGQAQMVQDTQKTWLMHWPRDNATRTSVPQAPSAAEHAPSAPEKVGPGPAEQVIVGMGDRAIEIAPELAIGFLLNYVGGLAAHGPCTLPNCQAPRTGAQLLDELNQANPLYGLSIGVIQVDEANEKGDYVGVGRAGMDVLSIAVMTAITLKAGGGRKVPNPNGKLGGLEHQALVAEVAADMDRRGLKVVKEHKIPTPNGAKSARYLDVAGFDKATKKLAEMHQIGKQTKGQRPVSREVKAMNDVEDVEGTRPTFHPYNKQ
jgi:RHS repeat-associated protein